MVSTVLACTMALLSFVQGAVAQYGYGDGIYTYQPAYGSSYGEYGMDSVSMRRLMQDMGSDGNYGYGMSSYGYGYVEPGYGVNDGASISGTYGVAAGRRLLQDIGSSGYGSAYGTYAYGEAVYGYGEAYYGM